MLCLHLDTPERKSVEADADLVTRVQLSRGHICSTPELHWNSSFTTLTANMRTLRWLAAALLPFTTFAAKKSSGDRYQDYQAQQASKGAPIKLDDTSFTALTRGPRDYSVAVVLTALEARFG